MGLFKCSQCGTVENTALTDYWSRVCLDSLSPLCPECLTGTWHNKFPKRQVDETVYNVEQPNGRLTKK